MSKSIQSAWVKAARLHIAENPSIYGRGASVPGDDAYLNFIDKKIIQPLTNVGLALDPTNYRTTMMKQFIDSVLDAAIRKEEESDNPPPINKNATLKLARSLKEAINAGFDI